MNDDFDGDCRSENMISVFGLGKDFPTRLWVGLGGLWVDPHLIIDL